YGLVVGDEDLVRRTTSRLLLDSRFRVLHARDGGEALEQYKAHKDEICVVLLDLIMPNMNGEQTYAALKDLDPAVRVLVVSGFSDEEKARRVLSAGAHGFLQKPYDADALTGALHSVLSKG